MNYSECIENARTRIGNYCKACPECNGRACKNQMPGPGAKGVGDTAIRNYEKWKDIRINMDTLCANKKVDTSLNIFGKSFRYPFFAGPVGAVNLHYGEKYNDASYNEVLVSACAKAGIAAMTGDGVNADVMKCATEAIKKSAGIGIPTVKPWNLETVKEKMRLVEDSGAFAVAMDVDAAGLPFLKNMTPPAGRKSVEELHKIAASTRAPFIVKDHDCEGSTESRGSRSRCDCRVESWRACAGSMSGYRRSSGRDCKSSKGENEDFCGWRNPLRCGCV